MHIKSRMCITFRHSGIEMTSQAFGGQGSRRFWRVRIDMKSSWKFEDHNPRVQVHDN